MEYKINVKQLGKSFNLDISYGDTFKKSKNRTYASASPYSPTGRLISKKFCSDTGKEVKSEEITHSIYKVGKQEFRIPKSKLKEIREKLASSSNEITIKAILRKDNSNIPIFKIDGGKWVSPTKKGERDYLELKELCKDYLLIGEAVFKSNSMEVILSTINDRLILLKLASSDRMTKSPDLDGLQGIEINKEILEMEKKILERNIVDDYDFNKFIDKRNELEDELIEKIAIDGEEFPAIKDDSSSRDSKEVESEMERLKKLLEKSGEKGEA